MLKKMIALFAAGVLMICTLSACAKTKARMEAHVSEESEQLIETAAKGTGAATAQTLREKRDEAVAELRKKYAAKLEVLAERERRAAAKVENEKAQLSRQV